jgi:quinol monooxygenase YgiN
MSRDDTIHYTLQFDVADGKMAGFEAPADEAIAQVQANEPGTVVFQWNSNGAKVELHERFADKRR